MSEYKLTEEILKRSQSKVWDMAKLEFQLSKSASCKISSTHSSP